MVSSSILRFIESESIYYPCSAFLYVPSTARTCCHPNKRLTPSLPTTMDGLRGDLYETSVTHKNSSA